MAAVTARSRDVRVLVAAAALAACGAGCLYKDQPKDGAQACAASPANACPDGYHCAADQRCWRDGHDPVTTDGGAHDGSDARDAAGTGDATDTAGDGRGDVAPDGPPACSASMHLCSGTCVDNNSVDHCGQSCDKCQAPDGGTPSCDGTQCSFDCGGFKKCNSRCVSGCCIDGDCPTQNGKTGQCDTSTNMCSYQNCATGFKPCGTMCIATDQCCGANDCTGTCMTCSGPGGTCVAVKGADDTDSCVGTCDASGACKSKQGQTCQTTAGGCVAGSTCAPDGYCCDTACTQSCMACDIAGRLGLCTAVQSGPPHGNRTSCTGTDTACDGSCAGLASGACSFPTKLCGAAQSCASATQVQPQSKCNGGTCSAQVAQTCTAGFACAASACNTTCSTSADCQPNYFCYNHTCHSDVVAVAPAVNHTCALVKDGRVFCWGGDSIGDGVARNSVNVGTPTQVMNVSGATAIGSTSFSSCAIVTAGNVVCWGDGTYGTLANGSEATAYAPVAAMVAGGTTQLAGATALYGGGARTMCALTSNGVYCWGDNSSGQLGYAPPTYPDHLLKATPLPNSGGFNLLAMGSNFQVAVSTSGMPVIYPWGLNQQAQVVPNDTIAYYPIATMQLMFFNTNIQEVVAGVRSAHLLLSTGEVQSWGGNVSGQLGNGTTSGMDPIPGHRTPAFTAKHITAGGEFVCAQTTDTRNIVCWGLNGDGVINPDPSTNFAYGSPTTVQLNLPAGLTVTNVVAASSSSHVCVIVSDGSLMCWGYNSSLQTGTGSTGFDQTVPSFVQANW